MSSGIIVLARMTSSRLPGKALADIGGRPLLGRVLDRVRRATTPATIVVATTDDSDDDRIAAFAEGEMVELFRGDRDDVAGRCLACADAFGFSRFARVCGDSPFADPKLIDRFFALEELEDAEVVTNLMPRTFPPGLSTEIVRVDALRRLIGETDDPEDREHVTRYFYRRPDRFRIYNVTASEARYPDIRLVVDIEEDLDRARWITARLGSCPENAALAEVVKIVQQWNSNHASATREPPAAVVNQVGEGGTL